MKSVHEKQMINDEIRAIRRRERVDFITSIPKQSVFKTVQKTVGIFATNPILATKRDFSD